MSTVFMRRSMTHKCACDIDLGDCIYRVEGAVDYSIIPGDPGCRTMRNGDPGYPPSPPEVEFFKPSLTKITISVVHGAHRKIGDIVLPLSQLSDSQLRYFSRVLSEQEESLSEHLLAEHVESDDYWA